MFSLIQAIIKLMTSDTTDNLILEHLRAMRADMAKMADRMDTMVAEMSAVRQHLSGIVTRQGT
jgi:hypothetical protein